MFVPGNMSFVVDFVQMSICKPTLNVKCTWNDENAIITSDYFT